MMRKLFVIGMAAGLIGLGGFVRDARAGSTIDLLFVGLNGGPIGATNTVTVAPSDVLTMAALMRNDSFLTIGVFSLNYDLDGDNELDVVSSFQWSGVLLKGGDLYKSLGGATSPTTDTFVGSYSGATGNAALPRLLPPSAGAFAGGYQMGTVTWHAGAAVNNDGADIISGLLNFGIDGWFGCPGVASCTGTVGFTDLSGVLQFNSATVNLIPEPGTASLLGLGLLGLVLMGRRARS